MKDAHLPSPKDVFGKDKLVEARGLSTRLQTSINRYNRADRLRVDENERLGGNITALVYRGQVPYNDLLSSIIDIEEMFPRVREYQSVGLIDGPKESPNVIYRQHNGVSLEDIRNMRPNPNTDSLEPEDITRINRFFRSKTILGRVTIGKTDKNHTAILHSLVFLATNPHIDKKQQVPDNLEGLSDVMAKYFDYYVNFVKDPDQFSAPYARFILDMLVLGTPHLPIALFTYLPAKLGISPSSTMKLFLAHKNLDSDRLTKILMDHAVDKVGDTQLSYTIAQAYPNNSVHTTLEEYIQVNKAADQKATTALIPHYASVLADADLVINRELAQTRVKQVLADKKNIVRQIMQSKDKYIKIPVVGSPIKEIRLTRYHTDTLMFVAILDNAHITLELNKECDFFGIPDGLLRQLPNVADQLITDILSPVLETVSVTPHTTTNTVSTSQPFVYQVTSQAQQSDTARPPQHRPRRALAFLATTDVPSAIDAAPYPKKIVAYDRDKVAALLGKRAQNPQHIDRTMATIRAFVNGFEPSVPLISQPGYIRLRDGKDRIILKKEQNGSYTLVEIPRRTDKTYRN